MKSLFLSTALAAGLGALALSPASAGALTMKAPVAVSPMTSDVACRTVERRKTNNFGVTKITRERVCDEDRYERRSYRDDDRRYVDRRDRDRRDERPGINLRIGQ